MTTNFNNTNASGKSFCVYCLKGLPPIKRDSDYKNWRRQFHKGGKCLEDRQFNGACFPDVYRETLAKNKALITRAFANKKTPQQQKRLDEKN